MKTSLKQCSETYIIIFQYTMLIVLITLGYLMYIQFSPHMGQIWIRNGYFQPSSAIKLMLYPFKNFRMWYFNVWDINYPMWLIIGTSMFYII